MFLVCTGLAAANLLFFGAVVRPRAVEYHRLTEESTPRLHQLENRKAQVKTLEGYVAALAKAEGDIKNLVGSLATKRERMLRVQVELAKLAKRFGINLQRIRYENEFLYDERLERFAMTVPLKGGYDALRKFLQAVEQSEEFLVVEQVALANKEDGQQAVELDITLSTYFVAPDILAPPEAPQKKKRRPAEANPEVPEEAS